MRDCSVEDHFLVCCDSIGDAFTNQTLQLRPPSRGRRRAEILLQKRSSMPACCVKPTACGQPEAPHHTLLLLYISIKPSAVVVCLLYWSS